MHIFRFKKTSITLMLIFLCSIVGIFVPALSSSAKKTVAGSLTTSGSGYSYVVYDNTNGLATSEANAIAETEDGFIWIGSYSGLIRYDSNSFVMIDPSSGITSVISLFVDSHQRLWIGTNDNGLAIMERGSLKFIQKSDGLPAASVQAITEDSDGNFYIATTKGLCIIDPFYNIKEVDYPQLKNNYISDIITAFDGTIYGLTKSGCIFTFNNCELSKFWTPTDLGINGVQAICPSDSLPGYIYLGTEGSSIYYGKLTSTYLINKLYDISPLNYTNSMDIISGRLWICADNGFCSLDKNVPHFYNNPFNNSIEDIMCDYQGNLWLTSSKIGVMKIVPNQFEDITKKHSLPNAVVSTTCTYDNKLFIGTKNTGIQIVARSGKIESFPITSAKTASGISLEVTDLIEMLKDSTIRSIIMDSKENLWISTYSEYGLIKYSNGEIICFTPEDGMPSDKIRAVHECSDGKIAVACIGGVAIIENDSITEVYNEASGFQNTEILTICEAENHDLLVGSDGDGIYIINHEDNKISHISSDNGLSSDIVMRIKKDKTNNLYWVVTSNALCYLDSEYNVSVINKFPYANNFDIFTDDHDKAWILSSNGIYVVPTKQLLENTDFHPSFYDYKNGLPYIATANSYSQLTKNGTLYIAGSNGVASININDPLKESEEIKVFTPYLSVDGKFYYPDADGIFNLPSDIKKITIPCYIFTYAFDNPQVNYYLEGFDNEPYSVKRSELSEINYTNLPGGKYRFVINLDNDLDAHEDYSIIINKHMSLLEYRWIQIFIFVAVALVIAYSVWKLMHITIISRQYEQIRIAKEDAEKANTAKSRFLANMSHEIRTPINTIMGMNEMILREDTDNVPKEYVKAITGYATNISQASNSLLGLINDLLDLSKIESGKIELIEQEYDTYELLQSLYMMVRVRANQKDLTFDTKIDEYLPKKLYGDVNKLKEVILNILTNAVKYTERGGFTLIVNQVERSADSCKIYFAVKDTGMGIKEEDLPKLFTAFRRLEEVKNSGIQGTGLGLDISHQYVELMGGELKCDSVYGKGSTFYFVIDQKIVDSEGIGVFKLETENTNVHKYVPKFIAPDCKILVVDDNEMNLQVIKGLLRGIKTKLTLVDGGQKCLDELAKCNADSSGKEQPYDLVLLDHMMPGMDGLETIMHIRENFKDLVVIALTANIMNGGALFYKNAGFQDYLSKPVNVDDLESMLQSYLPKEKIHEIDIDSYVDTDFSQEDTENEKMDELPDEYKWLKNVDGLDVNDGIKYCGLPSAFIKFIGTFYDTIDNKSNEIENAYNTGDISFYTIKVHALKSTSRIMGAKELSSLAEELESAGNNIQSAKDAVENTKFINLNTPKLLSMFRSYKDKLSEIDNIREAEKNKAELKPPISDTDLANAYEALNEFIPQMDYDAVEMILAELKEYSIPEEDEKNFREIELHLKNIDWDKMEEFIKNLK